mgnify:CR=1 FL=1
MEKVYGYARVSTREQNLDRQIAALRQYIADERDIITDKESGKDFNRPGYQYLREAVRMVMDNPELTKEILKDGIKIYG